VTGHHAAVFGGIADLLDRIEEGRTAGKSTLPLLVTRDGADRFVSLEIGRA